MTAVDIVAILVIIAFAAVLGLAVHPLFFLVLLLLIVVAIL